MARKLERPNVIERLRCAEESDADGPDTSTESLLDRREYVCMSMAAVASVAGFASGSAAAAEREQPTDTVLDAVADLGMDPTGRESIADALRGLPASAVVEFPFGTYLLDDRVTLSGHDTLGFLATGPATIKADGPDAGIHVVDTGSVTYEGFVHDDADGSLDHRWQITDELRVRDVVLGSASTAEPINDETEQLGTALLEEDSDENESDLQLLSTTSPDTVGETSLGDAYETIVLEPGEQRRHVLSDGERFENILIDQTAEGSMFSIAVESGADNWVIRNVGWKGRAPVGSENRRSTFLINVRGNGLIENIFIDQRDPDGGAGSDVGAIWTYSDSHHGHIECRHNFIAGCGNNGSYDSGDGFEHRGASGTVSHYRSYHRDNTPSNFRPGKSGSELRECVAIANDPEGRRGVYPGNDSQLTRAIWAWHNPNIEAINCAFWWDPADIQPSSPFWATHRPTTSEGSTCSLHLIDCDINPSWEGAGNGLTHTSRGTVEFENLGYSPSVTVLGDGVPLSAEMAASGLRSLPPELGTAPSGGADTPSGEIVQRRSWSYDDAEGVHTSLPNELVIDHDVPGERVTYEIEIDGDVEVGEFDYNASVTDGTVTGGLGPTRGIDNVYYDGEIVSISVDNPEHATIYLADAQERELLATLDPNAFDPSLTDVNRNAFELAASDEEVAPADSDGDGAGNEHDDVFDYTYAAVSGVHTDLPRELVIELVEPGERVTYEVEINGELEAGEVPHSATIDGNMATGGLGPARGLDNIYFDGEITRFTGEHLDRVRVFIADPTTREVLTELDPSTFPTDTNRFQYAFAHGTHTELPFELVIEHTDPGERVTYEVHVDGIVEPGEFDFNATVDGDVATGGLGPARGLDNLYFDGEIVSISGEALDHVTIYLADAQTRTIIDELDPADYASRPGTIRIEGTGTPVNYEITVDGELADDAAIAFDASGNISGSTAEGSIIDAVHGYEYVGDILDVQVSGEATIYVDDVPFDPNLADLNHRFRIDGRDSNAVSRYRFAVTGDIEPIARDVDEVTHQWDALEPYVTDTGVHGIVYKHADGYEFSGAIRSLDVRGPADVSFR